MNKPRTSEYESPAKRKKTHRREETNEESIPTTEVSAMYQLK